MIPRWFHKKSPPLDQKLYAEWIYGTLVRGKFHNIEPERMLLPIKTHRRYHEKARLYREVMSLYALWEMTRIRVDLLPTLREYDALLEAKGVGRGIRASPGELVDAVVEDLSAMFTDPFAWAQRWLMEFRDNPNTEVGTMTFAENCLRQYTTYKSVLEQNMPADLPRNV